jgi:hypothetical protein
MLCVSALTREFVMSDLKLEPADQQAPFSDRFSPFSADRLGGKSRCLKVLAMATVSGAVKKR